MALFLFLRRSGGASIPKNCIGNAFYALAPDVYLIWIKSTDPGFTS